MTAKKVLHEAPGGKRTPLAELVPLETPLLIHFFPIYACNFKCNYCMFSVDKEDRPFVTHLDKMSLELFKKCIDDLKDFPEQVKVLRIAGMGEPTLHPQLVDMLRYASGKSDKLEIQSSAQYSSKAAYRRKSNCKRKQSIRLFVC